MEFFAAVYIHNNLIYDSSWDWEHPARYFENLDVSDSLTFTTGFHGGFGTCSFSVYGSRDLTAVRMRIYLNAHIVIYDALAKRVYEGFVIDVSTSGFNMQVNCLGYYAKANDVLMEDLYPPMTQIETATVVGTVSMSGSASVTITSAEFGDNPNRTYAITVALGDGATVVATKIRNGLNAVEEVTNLFTIGGTDANVVLTRKIYTVNNSTLNISISNGSCTGLTAAPTSANTRGPSNNLVVENILYDCIDLIPSWDSSRIFVNESDYSFDKNDIDFEHRKVKDIIKSLMGYGYSNAKPTPAYFAIWENRMPHVVADSDWVLGIDWFLSILNINGESSTSLKSLTYSMSNVANKIYAVYDDTDAGVSLTLPGEDTYSQGRYGVIEAVAQNGNSPEGEALAEDIRDGLLEKYKYPTQEAQFDVVGLIKDTMGILREPYNIRAGHRVLITDLDGLNASANDIQGIAAHSFMGIVMSTSYSASSGTLSFTLGSVDTAFDVMLGRLGISGGLQ